MPSRSAEATMQCSLCFISIRRHAVSVLIPFAFTVLSYYSGVVSKQAIHLCAQRTTHSTRMLDRSATKASWISNNRTPHWFAAEHEWYCWTAPRGGLWARPSSIWLAFDDSGCSKSSQTFTGDVQSLRKLVGSLFLSIVLSHRMLLRKQCPRDLITDLYTGR